MQRRRAQPTKRRVWAWLLLPLAVILLLIYERGERRSEAPPKTAATSVPDDERRPIRAPSAQEDAPPPHTVKRAAPEAAPPIELPPGTQMLSEEFFPGTTDWEDVPVADKGELTLRMMPLRYNVIAPAPIAVLLEAVDKQGKKRPITSARMSLRNINSSDTRTWQTTFSDDGRGGDRKAGDGTYTASFAPSGEVQRALLGRVLIEVSAELPEGHREIPATVVYTLGPRARVVGWSDALREGSLALDADIDAEEGGTFSLMAQIFGPNMEPIAWVRQIQALPAGRGRITLSVFGKALFDAAIDGPYRVRQVLLSREHASDGEYDPGATIEEAYRTRAYHAHDFSPAAYVEPARTGEEVTAEHPSQRDKPPPLGTRNQR